MDKTKTPSIETIPLSTAQACVKKWREENGFNCKAFLIPADDLIACLEEMEILLKNPNGSYTIENAENSGIRAYLAIDRPTNQFATPQTEKLYLVATELDSQGIYRDIIEGEKPEKMETEIFAKILTLKGTGIYDFTAPCPNECDPSSSLFNP